MITLKSGNMTIVISFPLNSVMKGDLFWKLVLRIYGETVLFIKFYI